MTNTFIGEKSNQICHNARILGMSIKATRSLEKRIASIPGWFSKQDYEIFIILINHQSVSGVTGDVLEIGTYLGKSAALLGALLDEGDELYVCDLFSESTNETNEIENEKSYPDLQRSMFEKNYKNINNSLPQILENSSLELESRLSHHNFRFIHIDGSHLYPFVKSDLRFAIKHLVSIGGIIVMDDFRAQHALGVSKCVWEAILSFELVPLVVSAAKIYLVKAGDSNFDLGLIANSLRTNGFDTENLDLFDHNSIRVLGAVDGFLYSNENSIRQLVPPFLLPLLQRIKYYFRTLRKNF